MELCVLKLGKPSVHREELAILVAELVLNSGSEISEPEI